MRYLKYFESKYIGQCDLIRKTHSGEKFWQELMYNIIKISKEEFLKNINPYDILDSEDETIEDFILGDDEFYFAKSEANNKIYYFLSTHGFEFIWEK
jgi:hypothetical protein